MTALVEPAPAQRTVRSDPRCRETVSFSAIRTYQGCPLQYYFRYVAGLPKETISASLAFGSSIHLAIEHHFRRLLEGQAAPCAEELLAEYQRGWQEQVAPIRLAQEEDAAALSELAARMLQAFASSAVAQPAGRILAVEETLRGAVVPGVPDLLGRVDLIVEEPEELVISDWKTSRGRYSPHQVEESAEQLLLYAELARAIVPQKSVRLELVVLTKTKQVSIDRHAAPADPRQADRTKRIVERVWNAIGAEHFYPAPSPLSCCGCAYKDACRKWSG